MLKTNSHTKFIKFKRMRLEIKYSMMIIIINFKLNLNLSKTIIYVEQSFNTKYG